ncbi:hypothetical protein [Sodalis sp. (in: enterobacteria)]|uniref:hypothetical protein n=1 Tax=Sodalis sp. (in: enterobacteria) TaxID=1898979 RepID=UPI003F4132C5
MNYNQTLIVPNGIEHWEPRITGLEVYSGEKGGIILKPTEMGVATARWSLTAKMREAFIKILMQA